MVHYHKDNAQLDKAGDHQLVQFVFAVNIDEVFEPTHFGDADIFVFYKWNNGFTRLSEVPNYFKNIDRYEGHGSKKKVRPSLIF